MAVVVTAASVQDHDGARQLLDVLRAKFSRLRLIWADQAYSGELLAWVWALRPWRKVRLAIVKRPQGSKGFLLLPKRWIVERTFGWFGRYRRLAKDFCVHSLRATAATNALQHQADIAKVQVWLGHAAISTTQMYGKHQSRPEDSQTFKVRY